MPIIHQNNLYTLVIEFETDPAKIEALIDGIAAAVEQSFCPDRRFVSASFHASDDGRRMLNYAQWTSQADYEAFMNDTSGNRTRTIGKSSNAAEQSRSVAMRTPSGASWKEWDEHRQT